MVKGAPIILTILVWQHLWYPGTTIVTVSERTQGEWECCTQTLPTAAEIK